MENKMITIKATTSIPVGLNVPTHNFIRQWNGYGTSHKVPFDTLEEIYYDAGAQYLFKHGYLEITDKDARVALGLDGVIEDENGKEVEVTVKILKPIEQTRALRVTPFAEFKKLVDELPEAQIQELVQKAIQLKISDMNKLEYLGKAANVDLMEHVRELRKDEDEEKTAKKESK